MLFVCGSPDYWIWLLALPPYLVSGVPFFSFSYLAILLVAILLIFFRNRWAFVPVALLAGCNSIWLLYATFSWGRTLTELPNGWRFLANSRLFELLCVYPAAEVGPWLLIAVWSWRAMVLSRLEDGSPYPRRYCGRCYYNLHGLESEVCPERGSRLKPPAEVTRPTRPATL